TFAQTVNSESTFYTIDLIKVYFLLLLFATILNRLLEYLKLLLAYLNQKKPFLTKLFKRMFNAIATKLNRLGIDFDEQKLYENIQRFTISLLMQLLGFVLGILLAFALQLNVLQAFQLLPNNPTIGLLLSGLLIGAGVEPVHSFFRIAQEKRKLKKLFADLQK
ncbi:MAG: hypothetical protein D6707_02425, partial [Bacteroidetes bacterium]